MKLNKYFLPLFGIAIYLVLLPKRLPGQSIPEEQDGFLLVEAEYFDLQEETEHRKWKIIDGDHRVAHELDPDTSHAASASHGAYLEILPDSRTNHDDQLVHGINFSNEPGKLGVLHYQVKINNPGKYFVWVRAFSTGTEDNGLHVGLNGNWPESGQRMQWCNGKHQWTWESKQRTKEVHCGVEKMIYLHIDQPGIHKIMFSMREDGFEFDQWAISQVYEAPNP